MNKNQENSKNTEKPNEKKPNENMGFYFSSSVKIFDPKSQKIIVQKRGDI